MGDKKNDVGRLEATAAELERDLINQHRAMVAAAVSASRTPAAGSF